MTKVTGAQYRGWHSGCWGAGAYGQWPLWLPRALAEGRASFPGEKKDCSFCHFCAMNLILPPGDPENGLPRPCTASQVEGP